MNPNLPDNILCLIVKLPYCLLNMCQMFVHNLLSLIRNLLVPFIKDYIPISVDVEKCEENFHFMVWNVDATLLNPSFEVLEVQF